MSTPRRVSMGQRSAQGVAGYHHAAADHTGSTSADGKPTTPPKAPKAPKASSSPPAGTSRLSIYWRGTTLEDARRAYMADIDTQPEGPTSFARWIDRAVAAHANLSTDDRSKLAVTLGEQADEDAMPRSFEVQSATVVAMRSAIAADRAPGIPAQTRSDFVADAVRQATREARQRWGKDLPPAPARLPNRRWD